MCVLSVPVIESAQKPYSPSVRGNIYGARMFFWPTKNELQDFVFFGPIQFALTILYPPKV